MLLKLLKAGGMVVVLALLYSCSSRYPHLDTVEPLPADSSCKLVILPFVNLGEVKQGAAILYKAFDAELRNIKGFTVVPEGDVLHLYQQLRLFRTRMPNEKQMNLIGERLDGQYIISGDIVRISEVDTGDYVDTEMTIVVRLLDATSGKLLWETYHRRKGEEYRNVMHYGRVNSITGLARRMAAEVRQLWEDEGLGQCGL